ncbi:MAG: hypothetical protein ACAH80_12420 [Alphaproteobacteria bacterium]
MKKIIRDIAVIALLFALVLGVPLLWEEFSDPEPVAQATKIAPATPEVTATRTPPMPEPYDAGGSDMLIESARGSVDNAPDAREPEFVSSGEIDCSLTGSRSYSSSTSDVLNSSGDSFIIGGAEDKGGAPAASSIDGGGGTDTLDMRGMGTLTIDGDKMKNIEIIKVRNGVPNVLVVLPRGLAAASGRHIVIDGDTSDEVVLASCLEWRDPVPVTVGDVNYMRYDATDSGGLQASVSVSEEMRAEKR